MIVNEASSNNKIKITQTDHYFIIERKDSSIKFVRRHIIEASDRPLSDYERTMIELCEYMLGI